MQESHLIAAARARNSLEFVLNSQVRQSDLCAFQEDLRLQEEKHMKKLQNKSTSSSAMLSTTTTTTNSEGHENNSLKRKFIEVTSQQQQHQQRQQQSSEGMVVWNDALQQIENTMDLTPKLKYIPHVPLMEVSFMLFCSVGKCSI